MNPETIQRSNQNILYRNLPVGSFDEESRTVELAFSSEEPVERYFGGIEGKEVLDHSRKSVRLNRITSGGPLLADHRNEIANLIGKVESVSLDGDRTGRATVRFSEASDLARQAFDQIKEGILQNVSVGYRIHRIEHDIDKEEFRVVDWEPLEISMVAVPADSSVGVGRSFSEMNIEVTTKEQEKREEQKMTDVNPDVEVRDEPKIDHEKIAQEVRDGELARVRHINESLEKFPHLKDLAKRAINDGWSRDKYNEAAFKELGKRNVEPPSGEIGLTEKESKEFSFCRFILASSPAATAAEKAAGAFELEVSRVAADELERAGGTSENGNVVPVDVLYRGLPVSRGDILKAQRTWGTRDLTAGTATDGAELVATDLRAGSFIDVLRNVSRVIQAGATVLDGLQGNVAIPRKTSGSAAGWISAEGGAAGESDPQFDQVTLSPKDVGVYTDYSRRLLQQSSIAVEGLVRSDQAAGIATVLDLAGLYGTGSSGQPTGISNTSGINNPTDFAAADPTWAEVVQMETEVGTDNAIMPNSMAYMTDAAMRGAFKTTEKASSTAQFIWEQGNTVNGYPCWITEQVTDGDLFFGYWPDLLIGMWGGLDVLVDPYTASTTGSIRVVSMQTMDLGVRHPVSFAFNNDGA